MELIHGARTIGVRRWQSGLKGWKVDWEGSEEREGCGVVGYI